MKEESSSDRYISSAWKETKFVPPTAVTDNKGSKDEKKRYTAEDERALKEAYDKVKQKEKPNELIVEECERMQKRKRKRRQD